MINFARQRCCAIIHVMIIESEREIDVSQEETTPVDRNVIDGSRVVDRQKARHKHPATGYMCTWQDVDELLLEDGRIVYQCNSRYGNCPLYHENFQSVIAHVRWHKPTSSETDKAKKLPDPDRKIYVPIPDSDEAVPLGDAAAVVLGSNFTGPASLTPTLGSPFAANGSAPERVVVGTEVRKRNPSEATRAGWETRRANQARRAEEPRETLGDAVEARVGQVERKPLTPMLREGLLARLEVAIEGVHSAQKTLTNLDEALHGVHQTVAQLTGAEPIDPEIAEKAAKFDQLRNIFE